MNECHVFFGTYTGEGGSRGVYRTRFDPRTGALSDPELAAEATHPTFLALHPTRPILYAVDTDRTPGMQGGGAVSAFTMDATSGELTPAGQLATGTHPPCHLILDPTGRHLLFASYHDGRAGVLSLDDHGVPVARAALLQHEGSGPHPTRQTTAHAHSINLSPDHRFAFVADLGIDKLVIYRFDEQAGTLSPHDTPFVTVRPGAGPRHFTFHPNGRFAYLINELDSTIDVFQYDAAAGRLAARQTVSTLPPEFTGENTAAEIAVHPGGTFLYGSNRGHDSLVGYALDPDTGMLARPDWTSAQGQGPRHFAIHSNGRSVLVANQVTGTVAVMRLHPETGALTYSGQSIVVPRAVCVRFAHRSTGRDKP